MYTWLPCHLYSYTLHFLKLPIRADGLDTVSRCSRLLQAGSEAGGHSILLLLLAHALHVGAVCDVPHVDVLVHAVGETSAFLGGGGGAGGLDAGLEAVLVDSLK